MAVTKQLIKDIRALNMKKYRDAEKVFVAEGPKVVSDLLPLLPCRQLFATPSFISSLPNELRIKVSPYTEFIDQKTLERISLLRTPHDALAVFEKPTEVADEASLMQLPQEALCLALDTVQDPGNLGTIIRIADWFGIEHIFASHATADVYAPKVVQATMGAIGRVKVHYVDLPLFLQKLPRTVAVYGTFLDGTDIYEHHISNNGLIIMGNEGNGISPQVAQYVNQRLYIPPYPQGRDTSESLNVAVATAVVCAEFRRRTTLGRKK